MHAAPDAQYRQQIETYSALLERLERKQRRLGWFRLAVFVLALLLSYPVFQHAGLWGLAPLLSGLALLLFLVSRDVANNAAIRNTKTLLQLNHEERQILLHQFADRDDGLRFLPLNHAYAVDLDLFGKASLFQWLSRCYTEQGQTLLAANLLQPLPQPLVEKRQAAVKELAPLLAWRQQWQAHAMQTRLTHQTEARLLRWLSEEDMAFTAPFWKPAVFAYSLFTLASAVAALLGLISGTAFSALYLLCLLISVAVSRKTAQPYRLLNGVMKEAAVLQNLVGWIESGVFTSPHLQQLKGRLQTEDATAGRQLKTLKGILDRFDLRASIVCPLFFNPFLLWELRQMIALNAWRKQNKNNAAAWFGVVGEAEVLHSFATLHFNQPGWCFPQFGVPPFTLKGRAIGHPLLPGPQRVTNDFQLSGPPKIGLITGSNMAGKSTFLRSVGVNTVLAQTGAPVCAAFFQLSPVAVMSSMRIADNLAENTSTFYAELKKLRTILEAVKAHRPVLILLDEILRGTNSFDRHKGSSAFIRQLIKEEAVALIATHDVELAQLEKTHPEAVENYHFDVAVEGEELYFDYKLKAGICRSLNASLLMKKIGIDLQTGDESE